MRQRFIKRQPVSLFEILPRQRVGVRSFDNQSFCMDVASCDLHEPVRREQARPVR